jgi:hypothetical protein
MCCGDCHQTCGRRQGGHQVANLDKESRLFKHLQGSTCSDGISSGGVPRAVGAGQLVQGGQLRLQPRRLPGCGGLRRVRGRRCSLSIGTCAPEKRDSQLLESTSKTMSSST